MALTNADDLRSIHREEHIANCTVCIRPREQRRPNLQKQKSKKVRKHAVSQALETFCHPPPPFPPANQPTMKRQALSSAILRHRVRAANSKSLGMNKMKGLPCKPTDGPSRPRFARYDGLTPTPGAHLFLRAPTRLTSAGACARPRFFLLPLSSAHLPQGSARGAWTRLGGLQGEAAGVQVGERAWLRVCTCAGRTCCCLVQCR